MIRGFPLCENKLFSPGYRGHSSTSMTKRRTLSDTSVYSQSTLENLKVDCRLALQSIDEAGGSTKSSLTRIYAISSPNPKPTDPDNVKEVEVTST